ncbi:MAG: DLW-39 family protein [Promicromonosporaceae bacterium]|nr:DLW-39 family protein [Promicromonosporaceae bacterium]
MKKAARLIFVAALIMAGRAAWRRYSEASEHRALWHEVTDQLTPTG